MQALLKTGWVWIPANCNIQGQDKSIIQKQAMVRGGRKTSTKTQGNSPRSKSKRTEQINKNKQGNENDNETRLELSRVCYSKTIFVKVCLAREPLYSCQTRSNHRASRGRGNRTWFYQAQHVPGSTLSWTNQIWRTSLSFLWSLGLQSVFVAYTSVSFIYHFLWF